MKKAPGSAGASPSLHAGAFLRDSHFRVSERRGYMKKAPGSAVASPSLHAGAFLRDSHFRVSERRGYMKKAPGSAGASPTHYFSRLMPIVPLVAFAGPAGFVGVPYA